MAKTVRTEADWLAATTILELDIWQATKKCHRKWRLFGTACCRRAMEKLADYHLNPFIDVIEQFADGLVSWKEVKLERRILALLKKGLAREEFRSKEAFNHALNACDHASQQQPYAALSANQHAGYVFMACGRSSATGGEEEHQRERREQLLLARDIFGNPFRPVAFDPAWRTSDSKGIAAKMYDSREFSAMPILADALEEAGCDNVDILLHCRAPGTHVRGCWVVDLVLDKS